LRRKEKVHKILGLLLKRGSGRHIQRLRMVGDRGTTSIKGRDGESAGDRSIVEGRTGVHLVSHTTPKRV
jgi:hypothetical protein